ncbi:helix-turn-helix transcriptional regulator|uniref:helix-turn-helix domain-containing protein n=1 Tax=Noviherbaspirillum sp. L7-7A TaxID=2850560 RepID=UPI001C2BB190|nr:helix-turn-helix transcriptional regulator [Noviherbaspirillum sp. L7-7A]MBV0877753.1 helix-turn-helix transcriptional regulator [Noviherbaspirillum sp. L7-7A]
MESQLNLLLDIYDSAQHCTIPDFNQHALNKFRNVLQFDSAVIVDFSAIQQQKFIIQSIHLHDAPVEKMLDRPKAMGTESLNRNGALSSRDFVLKKALAERGNSVIANLTEGVSDPDILDYCRKYETAHSLTFVSSQPTIHTVPTIALWRAVKTNPYSEKDAHAANMLLPHILQAKRINGRLNVSSSPTADGSSTALATHDGCLHFVDPEVIRLIQLEWKEWTPPLLPRPLIDSLRQNNEMMFVGTSIQVKASVQGNVICMTITEKRKHPIPLSMAEYRAARLAAEGLSYKEIARQLDISPATIRNQLHSAYRKLGVSNKTALRNALPDLA